MSLDADAARASSLSAASAASDGRRRCCRRRAALSASTPLPRMRMTALAFILVNEGFSITMIFPYLPFLIADTHITDDPSQISFYAGWLASAFAIAQLLSSLVWGILADRLGRRPVILIGLIGSAISITLFGFSSNSYVACIAFRALSGLLNGNIGVAKTYLGEITDRTNQARAFSLFGLTWGLGSLLGPLIGGFLARPATQFGGVFDIEFFRTYPYVLPPLLSVLVAVNGFLWGLKVLKETLPPEQNRFLQWRVRMRHRLTRCCGGRVAASSAATEGAAAPDSLEASDAARGFARLSDDRAAAAGDDDEKIAAPTAASSAAADAGSEVPSTDARNGASSVAVVESDGATAAASASLAVSVADGADDDEPRKSFSSLAHAPIEQLPRCVQPCIARSRCCRKCCMYPTVRMMLQRQTMAPAVIYSLIGVTFIMSDELFPLWAHIEPSLGGLGYNTTQISIPLMVAGAFLLLMQLAFYHHIHNRLGTVKTLRFGIFGAVPVLGLVPFTRPLLDVASYPVMQAVLSLMLVLRMFVSVMAFTSIMVVVNESDPKNRSAMNGLAQTAVAASRAFGPMLAGILFSAAVSTIDYRFAHICVGFLALVSGLSTLTLRGHPSNEPTHKQIARSRRRRARADRQLAKGAGASGDADEKSAFVPMLEVSTADGDDDGGSSSREPSTDDASAAPVV